MKISQIWYVTHYEKGTVMKRITYPGWGIWGLAGSENPTPGSLFCLDPCIASRLQNMANQYRKAKSIDGYPYEEFYHRDASEYEVTTKK